MNTPRKPGLRRLFNLVAAAAAAAGIGVAFAATPSPAAPALSPQQLIVDALLRGDDARALLADSAAVDGTQTPARERGLAAAAGYAQQAATVYRLLHGQGRDSAKASTATLKNALQDLQAQILLLQHHLDAQAEALRKRSLPAAASAQAQQRLQDLHERLRRIDGAAASLARGIGNSATTAQIPDAQSAELRQWLAADSAAPAIYGANLPLHRPRLPAREPLLGPAVVPSYANSAEEIEAQAADYAASAEAPLSPLILAKAASLGNDYSRIVDFVRSQVRTQWYAGAQQGAEGTLRTLAGNDVDQASLLIALLRASRAPARYVRGVLEVSSADLAASLGVRGDKVGLALAAAGVAHKPVIRGGRIAAYAIEHVFVSAQLPLSNYRGSAADLAGATWIPLAPALKPHRLQPAAGALARAGIDAQAFIEEHLAQTRSDSPLQRLRTQLDSRLAALSPPLRYDDLLAQHTVDAPPLELLPTSLPAPTVAITGEYAELPGELRQYVRIVLRSASDENAPVALEARLPLSQLVDRRVSISYQPASIADGAIVDAYGSMSAAPPYLYQVRAQLQIAGQAAVLGSAAIDSGIAHRLEISLQGPAGESGFAQQLTAAGYAAIVVDAQAGQPPQQPDTIAIAGDSEPAAARLLGNLGARYLRDWDSADAELARLAGVSVIRPFPAIALVLNQYRIERVAGVVQSQSWRGVALDAAFRPAEAFAQIDDNAAERDWTALSALQGSSLEHRMFEQQWRVDSISADKGLQLAREQGIPVEALTPASGTGSLNQPPEVVAQVAAWLARGYLVDIPRNPLVLQAWSGSAWRVRSLSTGETGYFIAGRLAGGATVMPPELWYLQDLVNLLGNPYAQTVNDDPLSGVLLTLDRDTQDQQVVAGQAVARPLKAIVLDAAGAPVRGAEVTFRIVAGNGQLSAGNTLLRVRTDVQGAALSPFVSGARIQSPLVYQQGPSEHFPHRLAAHRIEISAIARVGTLISGEPFRVLSKPGPAASVSIDDDGAPMITGLGARSLHALVADSNGNGIANAPLLLRAETQAGEFPDCPVTGQRYDAALFMPGDCPAQELELTGHACTRTVIGDLHSRADGLEFLLVPANMAVRSTYTAIARSGSLEGSVAIRNDSPKCDLLHSRVLWFWPTLVDLPDSLGTTMIDAAPLHGVLRDIRLDSYRWQFSGDMVTHWQRTPVNELHFLDFSKGTPENVRYNDGAPGVVRFDVQVHDSPGRIAGVITDDPNLATQPPPDHVGWAIDLPPTGISPVRTALTPFSTTQDDITLYADLSPQAYIAAPVQLQLRADGAVVRECATPYGNGNIACVFDRGLPIDRSKTYTAVTVINDGTPFRLESAPATLDFSQGIVGGYGILPPLSSAAGTPRPAGKAATAGPADLIALLMNQYPKSVDARFDVDVSASYACMQGRNFGYVLNQTATVTLSMYRLQGGGTINPIPAWVAIDHAEQQAGLHDVMIDPRELPAGQYKFELEARSLDGHVERYEGVVSNSLTAYDALTLSHTFVKGVDLYTGGAVLSESDIEIGGRGPGLRLQRTYASHGGDTLGFLGRGWSADLDGRVETNECNQRIVIGPGGQGQRFEPAGELPDGSIRFTALYGYHGTLLQRGDEYDFYAKDGTRYHYGQADLEGPRLSYIEDTNGNRTSYTWEMSQGKPHVSRMSDSSGRQIDLVYANIRVEREAYGVRLLNQYNLLVGAEGPGGLRLIYHYDDDANLVGVERKDGSGKGLRYSGYGYQDFGGLPHTRPDGALTYTHFGQRLTSARDQLNGATRTYSYVLGWSGTTAGNGTVQYRPEQRVSGVTEADLGQTGFDYAHDIRGFAATTTIVSDARFKPTRYDMNIAGGVEKITDAMSNISRTEWNLQHRSPAVEIDALGTTTRYTYDDAGNKLTQRVESAHGTRDYRWSYYDSSAFSAPYIKNRTKTATDAKGIDTTYTYDERGNPQSLSRGGVSTRQHYAANGDLQSHTDGEGKVTKFRYDAHGYVEESESPLRHVVRSDYDERGRQLSQTDANGHTTAWKYDARDRQIETTYPATAAGTAVQTVIYKDALNTVTTTNPRGVVSEVRTDRMGRPVYEFNGLYARGTGYDKNGNPEWQTDFGGHLTRYDYDDLSRVAAKHQFSGDDDSGDQRTTLYGYDAMSHVLSETVGAGPDAASETRRSEYRYEDPAYARTQVRRELADDLPARWIGETTHYDANGNAIESIDAEGRSTTREYDDRNRLVRETAPLGKVTEFTYDGRDAKRTEKRFNTGGSGAQLREWIYDDDGRQTVTIDAMGQRRSQGYDGNGNVTSRSDALGHITTYTYDARNSLTEERGPEAGQLTSYAYDLNTNRIVENWPNGRVLQHSYDNRDRRHGSSDQLGPVETRDYSGDDLVTRIVDADNRTARQFHDSLHRLVREELPGLPLRQRRYSHSIHGDVLSETDPRNHTTTHVYDTLGRKTATTFPSVDGLSAVNRLSYDNVGNVVEQTNARNQVTAFLYNALNQRTEQTDAQDCDSGLPCRQVWTYDAEGNVLTHSDRRGVLSVSAYDKENRLVGQARDSLVLQTIERDDQGNVRHQWDALNRLTRFSYDKANRKIQEVRAGLSTEDWIHSPLGDVLTHIDADRRSTTNTYTVRRFLESASLAGETTHYTYDGSGHRLSMQRPSGEQATWRYAYDGAGRLASVTDPLSHVTAFGYDDADNRTRITDANQRVTEFHYDERNRLSGKTYPGGKQWQWRYDGDNNRVRSESPSGRIATTGYDALNRPSLTTYVGAPANEVQSTTLGYDGNGNVRSIAEVDASGTRTETRRYDNFDRLSQVIDSDNRQLDYRYDDVGNRTHLIDHDRQETVWTYNALNQNTHVYVPGQGTTGQSHTPAGRLDTITRPDGSTTTHSYNDAGRLAGIVHAKSGGTLASYSYRYDLNGNRFEQIETNGATTGNAAQTTTYIYDDADRLTEVREPNRTTTYTLDSVSNRSVEHVIDGGSAVLSHSILSYNERDQLTARDDVPANVHVVQTWDDNGNLATQTTNGSTPRVHTYDARDRLIGLAIPGETPLSFAYHAGGLRREKSTGSATTRYQYDDQSLLAETNAIGNTLKQYRYSANQLIGETKAGTTPVQRHFLLDALRSPIALLTQDGSVSARTSYDAFGEIRAQVGVGGGLTTPQRDKAIAELVADDGQSFGFTGYVKDTESGLYYAKARYYDPATARFNTEDPEAGKDMTPPSLHRYLYAYSNPTVYIDPTGRISFLSDTEAYLTNLATEYRNSREHAVRAQAGGRAFGNGLGLGLVSLGNIVVGGLNTTSNLLARNIYSDENWQQAQNEIEQNESGLSEKIENTHHTAIYIKQNPAQAATAIHGAAVTFVADTAIGEASAMGTLGEASSALFVPPLAKGASVGGDLISTLRTAMKFDRRAYADIAGELENGFSRGGGTISTAAMEGRALTAVETASGNPTMVLPDITTNKALTIASNPATGNPAAIARGLGTLNTRQAAALAQLPEHGSQAVLRKSFGQKDLVALTAETGDEFAMFTTGGRRLIIRGNENSVPITAEIGADLASKGWRWSSHVHPGHEQNFLRSSPGDRSVLSAMGGERSAIFNSLGERRLFTPVADSLEGWTP